MSRTAGRPRPTATVPLRIRQAFQVDGLFELAAGLVLMGNPMLGPDLGVSSGLVAIVGIALLVLAVFLGGAGLGKGPLAPRLATLAIANLVSGVAVVVWALLANGMGGGARGFLVVIGVCCVALGVGQQWALRHPEPPQRRRRATTEELRAAIGHEPK